MQFSLTYTVPEVDLCLLCLDAPCTASCPQHAPVDRILRSLYFANPSGAGRALGSLDCTSCDAPCEQACIAGKLGRPISIRDNFLALRDYASARPQDRIEDVDLSCDICGVPLENPFLLSSSVVASTYDLCARAFEAGWAGISFKTISSLPQHETSPRFSSIKGRSRSFFGFKNIEQLSDRSVAENMDIIRRLHEDFPNKVIIASIMGRNEREWKELAQECERAGASVIECNFSCPNLEEDSLGITIGQSEELVERFTRAVKRGTSLPVLAKLTPNITDMVPIALAARRGGADGIAAINTINSITGVDIDTLVAEPSVHGKSMIGGYSGRAVKPIALRFISDLARCDKLAGMHLSAMGGIETWRDGLEFLLLGAGSLQITTAVMQYGQRIIDDLLEGLTEYLRYKGIASLRQLIGGASESVVDSQHVRRDTITLPSFDRARCLGCGRCYLSCRDGGHQAITFDLATRRPQLQGNRCVGCHLCRLVCPAGAIGVAAQSFSRARTS